MPSSTLTQINPEVLRAIFLVSLYEPESTISLSLQPQNLSLKASRQGGVLKVMLVLPDASPQQEVINLVQRVWMSLPTDSVQTLQVCGQQLGQDFIDWVQEIPVEKLRNSTPSHDNSAQPGLVEQVIARNQQQVSSTASSLTGLSLVVEPMVSTLPDIPDEKINGEAQKRAKACPRCGQPLRRTHRKPLDRLVDRLTPVGRYACRDRRCGWEGVLPRSAK
uniref:Uncharacterized protein n=1 Tax=Cyanothece sp. (strain PCC 7425 / ATCC 29141) TaxID=395961 RepID=B8HMP0_CYAP4